MRRLSTIWLEPIGPLTLLAFAVGCAAEGTPSEQTGKRQDNLYELGEMDFQDNTDVTVTTPDAEVLRANVVMSLWHPDKWSTAAASNTGDGCTGTLLSPRAVLTAASCARKLGLTGTQMPVAVIGSRTPEGDPSARKIAATQIVNYSAANTQPKLDGKDLALVLLAEPVLEEAVIHHPAFTKPSSVTSLVDPQGRKSYALGMAGWSPVSPLANAEPAMRAETKTDRQGKQWTELQGDDALRLWHLKTDEGTTAQKNARPPLWAQLPFETTARSIRPKFGLTPGDNGGPLFVLRDGKRDVVGVASLIANPPDAKLPVDTSAAAGWASGSDAYLRDRVNANCRYPNPAPSTPLIPTTPHLCTYWVDVTDVPVKQWLTDNLPGTNCDLSVTGTSSCETWTSMHSCPGTDTLEGQCTGSEGSVRTLWHGDVDYTGPMPVGGEPWRVDADDDHTYDINPDGSPRDNCPDLSNPDQFDTDDGGAGDACACSDMGVPLVGVHQSTFNVTGRSCVADQTALADVGANDAESISVPKSVKALICDAANLSGNCTTVTRDFIPASGADVASIKSARSFGSNLGAAPLWRIQENVAYTDDSYATIFPSPTDSELQLVDVCYAACTADTNCAGFTISDNTCKLQATTDSINQDARGSRGFTKKSLHQILPFSLDGENKFLAVGSRGSDAPEFPTFQSYVGVPPGQSSMTIELFDPQWTLYHDASKPDTLVTCYRLVADPLRDGSGTEVLVTRNERELDPASVENEWWTFVERPVAADAAALNPATGYHWYRFELYLAESTTCAGPIIGLTTWDPTSGTPRGEPGWNSFKVRANADLLVSGLEFSFAGSTSDPFSTENSFNFLFQVPSTLTKVVLQNADADLKAHPDSPDLTFETNIAFNVYAPDESLRLAATSPTHLSGQYAPVTKNYLMETSSVTTTGGESFLPSGTWRWEWTGVDAENNVHVWLPADASTDPSNPDPALLDIIALAGRWTSPSGVKAPATWLNDARLPTYEYPFLVANRAGDKPPIYLKDVAAAKQILSSTSTAPLDQLRKALVAARLNLRATKAFGEQLETAWMYGLQTKAGTVIANADAALQAGSVSAATLRQINALNAGEVTYQAPRIAVDATSDTDGDGARDFFDNCPTVPNAGQQDSDRNYVGDACEPEPYVDCVVNRGGGKYTAFFGVDNKSKEQRIKIGTRNRFTTAPENREQPTVFPTGNSKRVVAVDFTSPAKATWSLKSKTATASSTSKSCVGPEITGLSPGTQTAILTNSALILQDGAVVHGSVANAGTSTMSVATRVVVGDIYANGPVDLRNQVSVGGLVQSASTIGTQPDTSVSGPLRPNQSPNVKPFAWTPTFPSSMATAPTPTSGQTVTLAPGAYNQLKVPNDTTLKLRTGIYFTDRLEVEPKGTLVLDQTAGPVVIYVRMSLFIRKTPTGTDGSTARLTIGYWGTDMAPLDAPFRGSIVAPNARIVLGGVNGTRHSGVFFGKEAEVRSNVIVVYEAATLP